MKATLGRARGRPGLTVLDLLISLALLSLILLALSGSLGMAVRLFTRSASLETPMESIAARRVLRAWLMAALPPSDDAAIFEGNARGMSFMTAARVEGPGAEPIRILVRLTEDAVLLEAFGDGAPDAFSTLQLVSNAQDVRLDYFNEATGAWQAAWLEETGLPALVRIRIGEGSAPPWPDFVVRPRLGP